MRIAHILKPTKKKFVIIFVLALTVILGFVFFGPKKPTPLQFAESKRQNIYSTVSSSGVLAGKDTTDLKFQSGGKLAYVKVKSGDMVTKYQLVAGLDAQLLNTALQQAYNNLRDAEAAKAKAEDDVKGHDSDETFAQRVTRTTAEVAKDNAFDSVKSAQKAVSDATITTPITGIVTKAIEVAGQNVTPADLIAQIVDTSNLYFNTDVDEADIGKVSIGMNAQVSLDAYPDHKFDGIVDQILPQTKTTSSNATVVTVRIKLINPQLNFVNGLSGDSSIITQTAQNAITIPQEALREDNSIVVSVNNQLVAKTIETGISSDTDIEVKSGLNEGEKVLLNPPPPGTNLTQWAKKGK